MHIEIKTLDKSERTAPPSDGFGFCETFTDHMFEQHYSQGNGWHSATIQPYHNISLDPATAVLHYAQTIFEGTKAYKRPDGKINLFRPWENMRRFN